MNKKAAIFQSWEANAENWIQTIENAEIESRNLVTNAAIVAAVLKYHPRKVLDLGCGEGWLTRRLQEAGMQAQGIDGIPALIENARSKGGAFEVISYEDIIAGKAISGSSFDAIVINFALLDKENTEALLQKLPDLLLPSGFIFIQTLHPFSGITPETPYAEGWREGSWQGLKRDFTHSYQWYYRTLESWSAAFRQADLAIIEIIEPLHPKTWQPASVIFVLKARLDIL